MNVDTVELCEEIYTINDKFKDPNDLSKLIWPLLQEIGVTIDLRDVIESLPHYANKLSLTEFLNIMVKIGYVGETKKSKLENIGLANIPCLFIPTGNKDAFIITDVAENHATVIEPNETVKKTKVDYKQVPTEGTIVCFSKIKKEPPGATWFQQILFRYKTLFLQILSITFTYNFLVVAVPLYIMSIYDKVLPANSPNMLVSFSLGIGIIVILMWCLNLFRAKALAYLGARLEKSVGYVVVKDILYLPPGYTENTGVGNQIARIKDFDSIRDFIASPVLMGFLEIPTTVIFILIIFILGGSLAIIPIVLAIVFHCMYLVVNPILNETVRKKASHSSARQDFLLEAFENIKDIKISAAIGNWVKRLKTMSVILAQDTLNISFLAAVISEISDFIMMFGGMLVIFFGALMAIDGDMSPGALIAIMLLTWKVLQPLKFFFANLPKLQQVRNSIMQVNNLMKIKTEEQNIDNTKVLERHPAKIEYSRVSFKYHPSLPPALLGISLVINPGELICITGNNGAGKTTMLRLLLGMYQPQAGNILINNKNIKQIPPISLRRSIGYLPQYNKLFFGTIRQNIMLCNPEASTKEIEVAARMANIYEEINKLPNKFETQIESQHNSIFSTSFLQRVMLARTFASRSNILLFDEPEASLDFDADAKFLDVIKWKRFAKTIIMVTHRPSHLRIADRIVNMHEGQIVQIGTPEQILPHIG